MSKILIVDDYSEVAEWIGGILAQQGHDTDVCLSGEEALVKIKINEYDLIITDIIMPEPDGIELCKFIREELSEEKCHVPIIAISGGAASIDARVALSAVAQHASIIMQKPLSPSVLRKAVSHLLQHGEQNFLA